MSLAITSGQAGYSYCCGPVAAKQAARDAGEQDRRQTALQISGLRQSSTRDGATGLFADRLQYTEAMAVDILTADAASAADRLAADLPDIAAALEIILPKALSGEPDATRRFVVYFRVLSERVAEDVETASPNLNRAMVSKLLIQKLNQIPLLAPSADAYGVLLATVNVARWIAGTESLVPVRSIDPARWLRFARGVDSALEEQSRSDPLERVMKTFDLNTTEIGEILGVSRQAVDKWLFSGIPPDRAARIVAMDEVATVLHRRLRSGYVAAVVRRPAEKFDGKTFLKLFTEGREQEVLDAVRASFDFSSVA
jgi:hypothetical protein